MIYGIFDILYIYFLIDFQVFIESSQSFLSHYMSRVDFEDRQATWSKKDRKVCNLEFFLQNNLIGCSRSSGATRMRMFQRHRFLKKLQVISGFAIFLFSLPAACGFHISSFFFSLYFSTLFYTRNQTLGFCTRRFCTF